MGGCETRLTSNMKPNNNNIINKNTNQNPTVIDPSLNYIPTNNQIQPPNELDNNPWDRSVHLRNNNNIVNQQYATQYPFAYDYNVVTQQPNPLSDNQGKNQMENEINKLKQQNEDINVNLKESKQMLNEQTDAKVKLENDLKNINQNYTALISEKNEKDKKINELSNENQQLKAELFNTKNQLNQKEQELKNLQNKYDEVAPILVGLDNIGATCYMNATLQSLSNIQPLTNFFLKKFKPGDPKKIMSNEYYKVVLNLWDKKYNGKYIAPQSFKKVLSQMNPLFAGVAANDSKDLINFLIETLHSELNVPINNNKTNNLIDPSIQLDEAKMFNIFLTDMMSNYKSIISDLFYGVLETQSKCSNCQRIKYNFQIYSFIEFPLEQVYNYCNSTTPGATHISQGIPTIDIYKCFEHYQLPTPMMGNNKIFCNECGHEFDAFYGTCLYSLPNYLIINLNRGKNAVFQCNVRFPEILKLTDFVRYKEGKTIFQLTSVICHYGESNMGGHFIAYCRHYKNNSWYIYNDSTVQKCTGNKDYLRGMPYILFYKALDDDDY